MKTIKLPSVPELNDKTTHQGWTDMAIIKVKEYREKVIVILTKYNIEVKK
jgi:hypothetical protein